MFVVAVVDGIAEKDDALFLVEAIELRPEYTVTTLAIGSTEYFGHFG